MSHLESVTHFRIHMVLSLPICLLPVLNRVVTTGFFRCDKAYYTHIYICPPTPDWNKVNFTENLGVTQPLWWASLSPP